MKTENQYLSQYLTALRKANIHFCVLKSHQISNLMTQVTTYLDITLTLLTLAKSNTNMSECPTYIFDTHHHQEIC